ncbi:hypothetical protein [Massilia brevitalea]|uniref:hypothetical protein n=1 Tax=Massilia brevitalea TaxID=442526 RepID=UPI0027382A2A|nr:hypothetical protein [Massilia brevitalea]
MEHSLQLNAVLDQSGVDKMLGVLRTMAGIRTVEIAAGSSRVELRYDDDLTSPQEIDTTISRSGFPLLQRATRTGGCCGSCGGV